MRNVIIFSDRPSSDIQYPLRDNDDYDVRVKSITELKEAEKYNPSVIVLDIPEEKLREISMVVKLPVPTLIYAEKMYENLKLRGDVYDYIFKPVNEMELKLRLRNFTRLKELREKISLVSTTDELTGLHNRRYLQERLEAEISRARRYGTKLSCLLFDIDFFKVVNDMYGYDWGDVLLKKIAEMLSGFIRKEDILTRYGDEEFIVILPNTKEENAFIFAERFRREIEKLEFIPAGEEERHPITISGGISSFPFLENVDENANTLIRYAEHALYNAKKRGKNKVVLFSQVNLDY
ncbi:MAG: diguanylate cyclase [Candidatus Gastranaerophilaceae bacterium]